MIKKYNKSLLKIHNNFFKQIQIYQENISIKLTRMDKMKITKNKAGWI